MPFTEPSKPNSSTDKTVTRKMPMIYKLLIGLFSTTIVTHLILSRTMNFQDHPGKDKFMEQAATYEALQKTAQRVFPNEPHFLRMLESLWSVKLSAQKAKNPNIANCGELTALAFMVILSYLMEKTKPSFRKSLSFSFYEKKRSR